MNTNTCLRAASIITSFWAMFVIAQEKNDYGVNRALVLHKDGESIRFFIPREIRREGDKKSDDGKKPYTYPGNWTFYCCPGAIKQGEEAVPGTGTLDGCLVAQRNSLNCGAYYCEQPINAMATFTDSCTVNQRSGRLYKIGYKYCYKNSYGRNMGKYTVGFLTVYNLCYDHENQQTLYVDYEINSLKLLRSKEIYEEEKNFITKPTTFGYEVENFEEHLKSMEKEMGDYRWEPVLHKLLPKCRVMLASRLHFPFVQLKRVLFHYSNIILVFNDIIQLFLETQEFITTISTIDELRIFAVPLYNRSVEEGYDDWEKYTPYVIGYLIFNKEETKGIAIILHNEDEEMKDNSKLQCDTAIKCPENYQINIINKLKDKLKGLVYCCNVNDVMNKWTFHPIQNKSNFDILNI